jgi:predicted Zn-dependent protease with MMP-like domain
MFVFFLYRSRATSAIRDPSLEIYGMGRFFLSQGGSAREVLPSTDALSASRMSGVFAIVQASEEWTDTVGIEETQIYIYRAILLRTLGTPCEEAGSPRDACVVRIVSHHHRFRVSSRT